MGAVYAAEHLMTGERVALKALWPHVLGSKTAVESFQLEARVAARLGSEHVVRVLDAGFDDRLGLPFLTMDLLQGLPLGALVDATGPLTAAETVAVMRHVASALDRAHRYVERDGRSAPIVHRDLKPDNLFVCVREGGDAIVKVLDFGIAKMLSESQKYSQEIRGTPLFMASEQFDRGPLTPRLDIWAFGLVTFYLLAGHSYWLARLPDAQGLTPLLNEVLLHPLVTPGERARALGLTPASPWSSEFDAWFLRCVNRDPQSRFESAGAAVASLCAAFAQDTAPAKLEGAYKTLAERVMSTLNVRARGAAPPPPRAGSLPSTGLLVPAPNASAMRHAPQGSWGMATTLPPDPSSLAAFGAATPAATLDGPRNGPVAAPRASGEATTLGVAPAPTLPAGDGAPPQSVTLTEQARPSHVAELSTTTGAPPAGGSEPRATPPSSPPTRRHPSLRQWVLVGGVALWATAALGVLHGRLAPQPMKAGAPSPPAAPSPPPTLASLPSDASAARPDADSLRADFNAAGERFRMGEYQAARELAKVLLEKVPPEQSTLLAEVLELKGKAEWRLGDLGVSEVTLGQAVLAAEKAKAVELGARARITHAFALGELSEFEKAHGTLARAKAIVDALPRARWLEVSRLSTDGWVFFREGKYDRAAALLREGLVKADGLPDPNLEDLALLHNRLGNALGALRRFDEAQRHFEREDALVTSVFGAEHPERARTFSDKGSNLLFMRRYEEAILTLTRALAFRPGPGLQRGILLANLGEAYEGLGRHREAFDWYEQASHILAHTPSSPSWLVATLKVRRGRTLARLDRAKEGLELCEDGLRLEASSLPAEHQLVAEALECVGSVSANSGRAEVAIEPLERALAIRQTLADEESIASVREMLATARAARSGPRLNVAP